MAIGISCNNCLAACCKGYPFLEMELTKEEHQFMVNGGNELDARVTRIHSLPIKPAAEASPPTSATIEQVGRYSLIGACAYLEDDGGWEYCSVYNDERRPAVCQNFEVGSATCLVLRSHVGLDPA